MAEEKNQKKGQAPQQDLNQLLKVRREKLAELQEAGQDPFVITKYDVTCHTAEAKEAFDKVINRVMAIVQQSAEGIDPEIADYNESCSGSCSTCGGCV